ncbi:MAG: Asp-tRNA(Asn)/Glu-tRNA(Gln) amidotransferase subunit GatC [Candidatus Riflebacteria bacterium]|nr:Asp-tRNA(Asn)/Glu-tRNA(Gln) amidotransferase subunit GatC [Candidatus Riflebacteria bacterium]
MFDIQKIAKLARLNLKPETESELSTQVKNILGYVEALQAVDTSTVEGYGLSDASPHFRPDEPVERGDPELRVRISARTQGDLFFVPKVIGEGDA